MAPLITTLDLAGFDPELDACFDIVRQAGTRPNVRAIAAGNSQAPGFRRPSTIVPRHLIRPALRSS